MNDERGDDVSKKHDGKPLKDVGEHGVRQPYLEADQGDTEGNHPRVYRDGYEHLRRGGHSTDVCAHVECVRYDY